MDSIGPNTNAPRLVLSEDCVLVCGEDESHLKPLLRERTRLRHVFRQYSFWKQGNYTVILSGMGTGCVEPLIWELAGSKAVKRIVLLGTAGKMPGADVPLGEVRVIAEAFLAGTGIDAELPDEALRPRWSINAAAVPIADSVSTDLFYGFGPRILTGEYPFPATILRQKYELHLKRGTRLVDMEVAPFYAFCERFGNGAIEYVAVKGAANELGAEGGQVAASAEVIERCRDVAETLLGLA